MIDDPESDGTTPDPDTIKITKENSIVFYQGIRIGVPRTLAGRLFYRTITADELCLWDHHTGELVLMIFVAGGDDDPVKEIHQFLQNQRCLSRGAINDVNETVCPVLGNSQQHRLIARAGVVVPDPIPSRSHALGTDVLKVVMFSVHNLVILTVHKVLILYTRHAR